MCAFFVAVSINVKINPDLNIWQFLKSCMSNVGVKRLRASLLCSALCTLAVSEAADLQAAVHRDETGGEQRADAKHEALDAVAEAARLSKHPGVTQADGDRAGI